MRWAYVRSGAAFDCEYLIPSGHARACWQGHVVSGSCTPRLSGDLLTMFQVRHWCLVGIER
jgi:hypothetical protein